MNRFPVWYSCANVVKTFGCRKLVRWIVGMHFRCFITTLLYSVIFWVCFVNSGACQTTSKKPSDRSDKVDFAQEVLPILSNKCFVCHGPDGEKASELRLDSQAGAMVDLGGYHALVPGDAENSELIKRVFDSEIRCPLRTRTNN